MMYSVCYCSPAGSTKHVADVLTNELQRRNLDVRSFDLGREEKASAAIDFIRESRREVCLFIGSPVYRDLAVSPIMQFIDDLPTAKECFAVPFVTWGRVSSGIALWQMAESLAKKGFSISGAAAVPAVHSMLWQSEKPLGDGRPDADDDRAVKELAAKIVESVGNENSPCLTLEMLDYQPTDKAVEMKKKLLEPPPASHKVVNADSCTQCGICVEHCPTGALALTPFPEFGARCMDCFNCVRKCPEKVIEPNVPLLKLEEYIRNRAGIMNEPASARIFVP